MPNLADLLKNRDDRVAACSRSLRLFMACYMPGQVKSKSANFHKAWGASLDSGDSSVTVAFRESAKTVYAFAHVLREICYRRRRNVMWYCFNHSDSEKKLYELAVALQSNPEIIRDFGRIFDGPQDGLASKERKQVGEFVTANGVSVKAMSVGMSPRGSIFMAKDGGSYRPDLVVLDDVDTAASTANVDTIEKNYQFVKGELMGGLAKMAQVIFLGNVIRNDGVGIRMLNDYKEAEGWRTFWQPAVDENGPTWPAHLPQEELDARRAAQGEIAFGQNYLLVPYSGAEAVIKRQYVQHGAEAGGKIVIGVDPAISTKSASDGFAIVVASHVGDRRCVLDAYDLRGEDKATHKALALLEGLCSRYGAWRVHVESVAFQAMLAQECRNRGLPVLELKPHRDKFTRLMKHQAAIEQGKVTFDTSNPRVRQLIEQLVAFPNSTHDDLVDAMVYAIDVERYDVVV